MKGVPTPEWEHLKPLRPSWLSRSGGDADDAPDGTPQNPGGRERLKTMLGTVGVLMFAAAFWYLYYLYLGGLITALSLGGFIIGVVLLPLGFWFLPIDAGGPARLFDWFGAATIGAWGLYLNSRERQEFVPVDDEAGVAYTSDGDVHFDVGESTEYQVGKRPFFLLHYIDDESAANTFRDGVDDFADEAVQTTDGGMHLFDRMTMGGQMQLATTVDPDTDDLLVDRKRFLSRFANAAGAALTRKAKQKIQKEEGSTAGASLQRNQLIAMAMGAVVALVATVIM